MRQNKLIEEVVLGMMEEYGEPVKRIIEVEVVYMKGGMNYFTGREDKRGYRLSMIPMTVGNKMRQFAMFSGMGLFLEEAKRFSEKRLNELAEGAKERPEYAKMLDTLKARDSHREEKGAFA